MKWRPLPGFFVCSCLLLAGFSGCGGSGEEATETDPGIGGTATKEGTTSSEMKPEEGETKPAAAEKTEEAPEVLLEPYDPPTLEELEAKVTWTDQRVVNPLKMFAEELAKEKPLTDAKTALGLRNDFPTGKENNAKILSALGRLPESDDQVDFESTFTRMFPADVGNTNPIMASSTYEFELGAMTGINLFGFDDKMMALANANYVKSWQTSEDRLYDKVVLRDDILWSDGKPFTAQDVVFSFKTIMNPKVPVPAVRQGVDEIRWVEAYDDHTLVFFHKEATPVNIWNINFPIIARHLYEATVDKDPTLRILPEHQKLENNPVSGGPYVLKKHVRGQELILESRENYYMVNGKQVREKPFFKTIRIRVIEDPNTGIIALKSGEIEESSITAEHWLTQAADDQFYEKNTKVTGSEWTTAQFIWNLNTPFFGDKRVRQAMSYAFNYDEMLKDLLKGLYSPAAGPFHPDSWMSPKPALKPYKQDLDKAEELLDAAGWVDSDFDGVRDKTIDGRKVPFRFTILTAQSPVSMRVCTLLKENLEQIGVICDVKPLEFTVLMKQELDHDFDATIGLWGTGTDPYSTKNIFGTGENRNFGSYSNKEVDKLYEEGMREFDQEKRAKIYAKIAELLYEDQVYTWLFHRNSFYGFNKRLRGYHMSPRGPYNYNPGLDSIWARKPE